LPVKGFPSPTTVATRLVWPMAALILLVLLLAGSVVWWMTRTLDQAAMQDERARVALALNDLRQHALENIRSYATTLSSDKMGRHPVDPVGTAAILTSEGKGPSRQWAIFLLNTDDSVLFGSVGGEVAGQPQFDGRRRIFDAVIRDVRQKEASDPHLHTGKSGMIGATRIVHDGWSAYVAAATTISSDSPHIVVGASELDARALSEIAGPLGLQELHLSTNSNIRHSGAVAIDDATDRGPAFLVWQSSLPSALVNDQALTAIAAIALLTVAFAAGILLHVRGQLIELSRRQEQVQRLAAHDSLSGLPNRLLFGMRLDQELARIKRSDEGLAVMFLDLDRFKDVNDTYGHEAGDMLIRIVARRLSNLLRGADTLARFGGDEFAIIQTDVKDPRDAEALARRILDALTMPCEVPGGSVTIGVSIGVALSPRNGTDRETLMRLADTALYQAKNGGRNRYSFFERQMDEALRLRKVVEDDLRAAILADELQLHYQPQYKANGEEIVGVEALVRWPHPQHGWISPQQFIAIAEERGLIIPLGEWVLRKACEDAKRWPGLRIAVNVSPIQFRQRDFVSSVMNIIEEADIDPTRVELEVTEGVVMDDADAAEEAMMELRARGVRLALDDFGTGYSSLIYLRRFAFDKIKIDRSFLESMETTGESAILVHSVVHLGRALGLTVTAEGVETSEQHRFLQALGCHELQGYLFSKPVPAHEIDKMLGIAPDESRSGAVA
jgi:diguanylate cyclase (GGDEF)-like protein